MTLDFSYNSSPNPAKLIESLRHLGYNNYSAIADLVDNSFDADATEVHINITNKNSEPSISIADNGSGMDETTLKEAIKLGSETPKSTENDLGKFGMGLCTATLSICRQTIILTQQEDQTALKAVNDIDVVIKTNNFMSFVGSLSETDKHDMPTLIGKSGHGTVVILNKCDLISNQNNTVFANTLGKHLSRVFRVFLSAGKKIYINGKQLQVNDPLHWNNPETERYDDGQIEVKYKVEGKEHTDTIRIKLAILPEDAGTGEKEKSINLRNQGFYIMRNNREMLDAVTLGLFNKHNDFNRMRGEISFSGNLDNLMGVNFTKRNVALNQAIEDQLGSYLKGQIASIRKRIKATKAVDTPEEVSDAHEGASKEIRKKSKLLITPKAPKESRQKQDTTNSSSTNTDTGKVRNPKEGRQQSGGFTADCEFSTASMTAEGPIYSADKQGRKIIITYNADHPFYQSFILENSSKDKGTVIGIDYLIYSLACAELSQNNEDEDVLMLLSNLKSIMSANLKTLLS